MNDKVEEIVDEIVAELKISKRKVNFAVRHFWDWQRIKLMEKAYAEYKLPFLGSFKIMVKALKADAALGAEYNAKKKVKITKDVFYTEKNKIIQEIKMYDVELLDIDTYKKYMVFFKNKQLKDKPCGFRYTTLFYEDTEFLLSLLNEIKKLDKERKNKLIKDEENTDEV